MKLHDRRPEELYNAASTTMGNANLIERCRSSKAEEEVNVSALLRFAQRARVAASTDDMGRRGVR